MNQFEMKQRAYQSPLKSRALQVLLYLIDRSDKEHTCFPAVPTIARQLHISVSTVKRAMRELVEEGYVKKESRFREGNRGQTSNLYFLFFPENTYEQGNEETVMKQQEEKQIVRGHRFVRYADDCMIFCKSRKSAERTLENIIPFIEGKLFLKVNWKKTKVAYINKVKYLGYTFHRHKGKCRFRVHPKSVTKMKNKIRELTDRNNGMSNAKREEKYQ